MGNIEKNLNEYTLKRKISQFLHEIKMKTSSIGFNYWLNAITYSISRQLEEGYDIPLMAEVYAYLSKKYKRSVSCIEKAMRYAKNQSKYIEYWYAAGNMKNGQFLLIITNKIIEECFISNGGEGRKC